MIPDIRIEDYNYPLPGDRIAKYPLAERDSSKLLRYENGVVKEYVFREIPELLPSDAVMVFNDTKVVPARLHFVRPTGARIEIFCLQPVTPEEYNLAFATTESCIWKCVIGNAKKWKGDVLDLYNPAPRFMCPTSELPICPSGRPTASPHVRRWLIGYLALRESMKGVPAV